MPHNLIHNLDVHCTSSMCTNMCNVHIVHLYSELSNKREVSNEHVVETFFSLVGENTCEWDFFDRKQITVCRKTV